ncbi:hypothetical protein SDC9_144087 [bioreactor metagenome]|uniref:Uncharacterized protein n=1 Tax=bioreactor metagenome TaxID=1076179 RepID=A0A645E6I0_9ZZZZ
MATLMGASLAVLALLLGGRDGGGHDTALHPVAHLVTGLPQVAGARSGGDLVGEVDDHPGPADEVAGAHLGVVQHLGQRQPGAPVERGPGEPGWQLDDRLQPGVAFHQGDPPGDPADPFVRLMAGQVRHPLRPVLIAPPRLVGEDRQHRGQLGGRQAVENAVADALGDDQVRLGVDLGERTALPGDLQVVGAGGPDVAEGPQDGADLVEPVGDRPGPAGDLVLDLAGVALGP